MTTLLPDRIRLAREHVGMGPAAFGKAIGRSERTVYNYETGESAPGSKVLQRVAEVAGVSEAWLLTGKGPMLLPGQGDGARGDAQEARTIREVTSEHGYPYMIGGVGAGSAGSVQHWDGERVHVPSDMVANWTGGYVPAHNEAYWTRVRGTSMEPWLPEETPIFVVRCDEIGADSRYVLFMDDDHAEIVKRVENLGDGVYLLKPDNPAHSTRKLRRIKDGDDHMYEDLTHDVRVMMRVRGRVVYPTDTAQAILGKVVDSMSVLVSKLR